MANASSAHLRRALRNAGLSRRAIDAAWPEWWSEAAESSPSARAQLRFALAGKLGLSPKALVGERIEFVWRDRARFKNLTGETDEELSALNSFGTSIGRILMRAARTTSQLHNISALRLRQAILASGEVVSLTNLLTTCWAIGVPTIALKIFPLKSKSMHAMVVGWDNQHAILLAREASYPATVAFTLAHEIGHAALGHVVGSSTLVDIEDPATSESKDDDELAADRYALTLLTGSADPDIRVNLTTFGGRQLAGAALETGPSRGIEPGTLALCVGFRTGNWAAAMSSLKYIYSTQNSVAEGVNNIANKFLDWDALDDESADYLKNIMGRTNP